ARHCEVALPAKAKACDGCANAAFPISALHRRRLHDVIRRPLCVIQRALHTGLLACIWAVKLIRHGALPDISEPRRANWSPVQRAQFKTFAWTTVAIVGAWHAVGRRLEPHARLCVAVAQVVKLKAGCVANSK